MMGLFFGRISKGRTIRQVVLDYRVWRPGDVSFLGIAGAYVLHLQSHGLLDAVSIINSREWARWLRR